MARPLLLLALCALLLPTAAAAGPKAQLCTEQRQKAIEGTGVILRKGEKEIFVAPFVRNRMDRNARQTLTVWAAHCLLETSWIAVKHAHTEEELARWSKSIGYRSSE